MNCTDARKVWPTTRRTTCTRYKQMKDIRPFEGIMAEQACDRLRDQTLLSILSWNAGEKKGKET